MKKCIFLLVWVMSITFAKAQIVSIANETFEGSLTGWTITPGTSWRADTNLYVSSHTSYKGIVPIGNNAGDTSVLTSPLYNFSSYSYIWLQFSHICKVSGYDICRIEYKENYGGASWAAIPTSSYKGSGVYTNAMFNHASYTEWQANDSLATPGNTWWKTENFDVSDEVSYAQVQFRFIITRGTALGTYFVYGWLIDNFNIIASNNPISPPEVAITSTYGDTVFNTGPFEIEAKVATRTPAPLLTPKLYYAATYNNVTTHDSIVMIPIAGDSMWKAIIPQHMFGTSIVYSIVGMDTAGNTNYTQKGLYIKRLSGGGLTGYVIVGNGIGSDNYVPMNRLYDYSWSRMLYLSSEINPVSGGGLITKLAWQVATTGISGTNQSCYFKEVTDNAISNAAYINPVTAGATLVWSGTYNLTATGWTEVTLQTPFVLTPGKNLLIYWENRDGSYTFSYSDFYYTVMPNYMTVYDYDDDAFPAYSTPTNGGLDYDRPNVRFYVMAIGGNDTNSVAMHSIDSPLDTVNADPVNQTPVVVSIKNKGIAYLDSCYINWTLNGLLQAPFAWKGHLPEDFNAQDTIGYYAPKAGGFDTLVIWTSYPNGTYDSTSFDDTLSIISHGQSGLNMAFVSNFSDTVYNTGPFTIKALISSRTSVPVPLPVNLMVIYTYNGIDSYDTLPMTYLGNDTFSAVIPQHIFGTVVHYAIYITDSFGNIVSIQDKFCINRGSVTGYVIVGNGTSYDSYAPMYRYYDYSWSRILYLASELSPSAGGGLISKLAWQVATTGTSGTNQSCYFKEVTDNTISNVAYINPVSAGATLVWSGTYNLTATGWAEVTLQTPFILTPGKNLLVYWENKDGSFTYPYSDFYYTITPNYMTVYDYDDGSFPAYSIPTNGGLDYARPNARFYISAMGGNDSNSVAMFSIDSPQDTVFADPVNQTPVIVTIKNKGIAYLDSCYINWTLNGLLQAPFAWKGHLPEDFNVQDTIGYYPVKAGGYDTLVIWTSYPNGVYDSTNFDDTLSIISYGQTGINVAFVSNISDTVYNTGPFTVKALISSRTASSVPTPVYLYVRYTYNAVNTYDTLLMTYLGNDTFSAAIPQQIFGTDVHYTVYVTDSFGNKLSIHDNFYIKRLSGGGVTGYVIVGNGTNYDNYTPMNRYYNYSWSRMLYLASEINPASGGGLITKLAWQLQSSMANATNQSCYFQEVSDNTVSSDAYINPVTAGATLVWSGTYNLSATGWSEVTLQIPFTLNPGKNLLIYWENKDGNYDSPYTEFYYSSTPNYMVAYDYQDANFPNYSTPYYGGLSYDRANARFYVVTLGNNDSNSVAMYSINHPMEGTMGGTQAVHVTIKNKGIKYLDSCYLHWSINGVLQTPVVYRGHLPEDFNDTITLGYYTQRYLLNDTILVWVSMPNGQIDTTTKDDTLQIISYGCYGPVSGDFIVGTGAGADVASITEAYYIGSRCGVNGDIMLKLQNGVYVENVVLADLENLLGNYTLTITSLSGNKDSVIIRPNAGNALHLHNTANVNVNNITFDVVLADYAVLITGDAKDLDFNHCNFYANPDSITPMHGGIYQNSSGNTISGLIIRNSNFNGGYFGIGLDNSSTSLAQNVRVDSNTFTNHYYFSVYYYYVNAISTSFNTIHSRNINNGPEWCGMYLEEMHKGGTVIGNKIYSDNVSISDYLYGIYTYYVDSSLIANNEIYLHSNADYTYGIFIDYPKAVDYIHNTVLITGSSSYSRAVYWYTYSDTTYSANMKNNIFVANGGTTPYAMYLAGSYSSTYASYYGIDYNNYYSSGNLGYVSSSIKATLSNWQNTVLSDVNSTNLLPDFIDSTINLKLTSYNGFSCPTYPGVNTDIEGNLRLPTTAKGCYADAVQGDNGSLVEVLNWRLSPLANDSSNLEVVLKNAGTSSITSATINWSFNNVLQTPVSWSGNLPTGEKDTLILGKIFYQNGTNQLVVYLSALGSLNDQIKTDDTLRYTNYACASTMQGYYTVGPNGDFSNLADAFDIINTCSMSATVTLALASGTYNKLSLQNSVLGANTHRRLIITSMAANADSVVFTGDTALILKNASYFTFKDVTFNGIAASYTVFFSGINHNIEFNHCKILSNPTTTTSGIYAVYKASGGVCHHIRFVSNTINGGYYGVYFYAGTSSTVYGSQIVLDSNIISNQYRYATYLYYIDSLALTNNTVLSRASNTNTYWNGLHMENCNVTVRANKIHQRSNAISYPYLAYLYNVNRYNTSNRALFANNELIGYSTSTYYGVYVYYSPIDIYNNSIHMSGTGAVRNIYISSSTSYTADCKNNLLVNTSLSGHPIYVSSSGTYTGDYNNLYGTTNIGNYNYSNYTTLAAWISASNQDQHSLNINPSFININTGLQLTDYSLFIVPRLSNVLYDIDGKYRTAFTTIGAYSIPVIEGYNLELSKLVNPVKVNDVQCLGDYTPVKVIVKNSGTEDYYFNSHPMRLSVHVTGATNYNADTIITSGFLTKASSDTFDITTLMPIALPGNYQITVSVYSGLDTNYFDDTLRSTYTVNPITLPYDVDFSTTPSEFIFKQVIGSVNWQVVSGSGSNPSITPVYGSGRLEFASSGGMGSIAQAILNNIDLRGTHYPSLEFWYAHDATSTNNDLVVLKISTDGGASFQTLKTLNRYDAAYTTPGWEHVVIDLTPYSQAACLSIVFEASSFGGANQSIDRIRIFSEKDIAVKLLSPQVDNIIACNLTNHKLQFIIENLTAQAINFANDTTELQINITGADNQSFVYPLHGQLQGFGKDTLLIIQTFDLSTTGTYNVKAYIHAVDNNTSNDTVNTSILIHPDISIKDLTGVDDIHCKKIGDSVYVGFKIINTGNLWVNQIPVRLQINGGNDIAETILYALAPGDSTTYLFTKAYVVPTVTEIQPYYMLKVKTELACDAMHNNDEINLMGCVDLDDFVDLQIQTTHKPTPSDCDSGLHLIQVSATLWNQGTIDIDSAQLFVVVDSAGYTIASFSENTDAIASKAGLMHTFTQAYVVPNFSGNYNVKVYLQAIPDDENLNNDTAKVVTCAIYNDVSIYFLSDYHWTMGQNIPNPVTSITHIPYAIPQDGIIIFRLMTVSGQILHTIDIPSLAGTHSLEFDTDHFANGIYYYSMEYKGQRIVKKMTIQK